MLKGTILFAIFLSVIVYIIRLFVKFSISSIHLARDAHERLQLTYVYLALSKEGEKISTQDRQIFLQAILSRADTGLLKGERKPEMPGVISKLFKDTSGA